MIILGLCLGLAALLVHGRPDRPVTVKSRGLDEAFVHVGSWSTGEVLGFDQSIVDALELDDYTHRIYTDGTHTAWVYIGYYLTGDSIGASHSPLVCYPGQGWQILERERLVLDIGELRLHLMSMVAAKNRQEDVVLYWFQAFDRNAPDTFRQKLQAMWARVTTGRADSAFVRISVPVEGGGRRAARRTALAFVEEFYPLFHAYVTDTEVQPPADRAGAPRG